MRIIPILPNQEPAILLDISPFHHQFLGGIPNQRELVAKKVPWFHQKQMAQAPSPPWNSSINGCLLLLVRGTRSMVQKHLCILYMYISHIGLYMSCQLIIYVTTLKPYNRLKKKTESRIKIQHLQHVRISPTTRFGQILLCIRHCGQQIPNHTAIRSSHIATGPTRETTWPVRLPASTSFNPWDLQTAWKSSKDTRWHWVQYHPNGSFRSWSVAPSCWRDRPTYPSPGCEEAEGWYQDFKEAIYMDVSLNGGTPKSSILIGFSIINHPFWGTPTFWKHPYIQDAWRIPWQTSVLETIAQLIKSPISSPLKDQEIWRSYCIPYVFIKRDAIVWAASPKCYAPYDSPREKKKLIYLDLPTTST